jgi:hypothetical protein
MERIDHGHARLSVDFSPEALKYLAWLFMELIGNDEINLSFWGDDPEDQWAGSEISIGDFFFYDEPDASAVLPGDYAIAFLTSEGEGERHVAVAQLVRDALESVQKLYRSWNEANPNRRGSAHVEKENFLRALPRAITIDLSRETLQSLAWLFLNHVDETRLNLEIFGKGDGSREIVITQGDEDSRADLEALGYEPLDELIVSITGEADVALALIAYDTLVSVQEFFKEWAEKVPLEHLTEEGFIEALRRHNP